MVEEQLEEVCFVIRNVPTIRAFKQHRSARLIQGMLRQRRALIRRSAAIIVRNARGWLARGSLRRARIFRSILRHRGSLSRRALGLSEKEPSGSTATCGVLARAGGSGREGRWWDVGAPVVPRPRWGKSRVAHEEARSRQRAASLADLIMSSQKGDEGGARDAARVGAGENCKLLGGRQDTTGLGFEKGFSTERASSMIDPRQAQQAAWKHEVARKLARKQVRVTTTDDRKLRVRERHLLRQREYDAEQEKRRLLVEREVEKHVGWCLCPNVLKAP